MPNSMRIFPLRFRDKVCEKEYVSKTRHLILSFYCITLVVLSIMCLYSTIYHIIDGIPKWAKVFGSMMGGMIIILLLRKFKIIQFFLPLIGFGIGLSIILINLVTVHQNKDVLLPFIGIYWNGYAVGMFQMLLIHLFLKFEWKLLTAAVITSVRWGLIPIVPGDWVTVLNISFIDIANLMVMYYYEKYNRRLFKNHYDYQQELKKFKTLLTDHLPHNIIIVNKRLDKVLFTNNSFIKHFKVEELEQAKEMMNSLKINLNTLDSSSSSLNDSSFNNISEPSLLDYLNFTRIDKKSEGHITCFNVELSKEKEGETTMFEVKVFHLIWDGECGIIVLLNDLTQQQTILALKIADENKDRLLATVSHELRTPINGMLGITEIIEQEFQDPKLLGYCRSAKVCAKMLMNLVNSILDLAQLRNLCLKLNPATFKIQTLVEEVESIFKPQCSAKHIKFKIKVSENVPVRITSDQNRLIQVIINLLANSLKFTFTGHITLSITKETPDDQIEFKITDSGVGIQEEDKSKLFKAFGKVSQTNPKINPHGVGLGLTISNSLVNMLNTREGAKIEFESVYGEGSKFYFTIATKLVRPSQTHIEDEKHGKQCAEKSPLLHQLENFTFSSESLAEFNSGENGIDPDILKTLAGFHNLPSEFIKDRKTAAEIPTKDLGSILASYPDEKFLIDKDAKDEEADIPADRNAVLIVDDNSLNLMIASKLLQKYGLAVVTAYNGQDAIAKVKEQSHERFFDFILMDCQMPIMDGFEATKKLKEMIDKKEIPNVPIFALTANDSAKDQEKCLNVGMTGTLSKPLRQEELQKLVQKYVQK